eukprot:7302110-Prymnesium_polylepis.2
MDKLVVIEHAVAVRVELFDERVRLASCQRLRSDSREHKNIDELFGGQRAAIVLVEDSERIAELLPGRRHPFLLC